LRLDTSVNIQSHDKSREFKEVRVYKDTLTDLGEQTITYLKTFYPGIDNSEIIYRYAGTIGKVMQDDRVEFNLSKKHLGRGYRKWTRFKRDERY